MSSSSGLTKFLALAATSLACWLMLASPASAQTFTRSYYQNAGGSCHGIDQNNESKLLRNGGRLKNVNDTVSADVVCNLMTDAFADAISGGVVTGAWLWIRRSEIRSDNTAITCTMTTSYAGDPNGLGVTKTVALPSGLSQGVVSFIPTTGTRFLAPVNIRCKLPPKSELNDWLVTYEEA